MKCMNERERFIAGWSAGCLGVGVPEGMATDAEYNKGYSLGACCRAEAVSNSLDVYQGFEQDQSICLEDDPTLVDQTPEWYNQCEKCAGTGWTFRALNPNEYSFRVVDGDDDDEPDNMCGIPCDDCRKDRG